MIDLDALKARLAEYDDARPRCQGKVARNINCAPDHLTSEDPTYHEYIITTYSPCCRPEGHESDCRNSRSVMGWPGFVTVSALAAEVERLRDLVRHQRGPLFDAGLLTNEEYASLAADHGAVDRLETYDDLRKEVEHLRAHRESCHANLLKGYETGKVEERAVTVAWLLARAGETANRRPGNENEISLIYSLVADMFERGEHRKEES